MNKKIIMICVSVVLSVALIITLTFGWIFYHFMWDTQSVAKGECLQRVDSPKKKYRANVYEGTGGATVDFSVIVEIEHLDEGTTKNIYFEYHKKDVKVKWISETKISIDGKKLNILKDVYDWRHQ